MQDFPHDCDGLHNGHADDHYIFLKIKGGVATPATPPLDPPVVHCSFRHARLCVVGNGSAWPFLVVATRVAPSDGKLSTNS